MTQSYRDCDLTATSFWTKSPQIAVRSQYGHSVVVVGRTGRHTVAGGRWGILNCSEFLAATFRSQCDRSAVDLRSHECTATALRLCGPYCDHKSSVLQQWTTVLRTRSQSVSSSRRTVAVYSLYTVFVRSDDSHFECSVKTLRSVAIWVSVWPQDDDRAATTLRRTATVDDLKSPWSP